MNLFNSHPEAHTANQLSKLNWLRAGVLGADDGIVSISGLVLGMAGASASVGIIFTAGLAGLAAGAISMAAGEYVSVSSSRDTEKALLEKEVYELKHYPKAELEELTGIYEKKGLSRKTARIVASELSARNVHAAHFDAELGIDPNNLTNPWHAAFASALSFLIGGVIPVLAILLPPEQIRLQSAFVSVVIALIITGFISAKIGGASEIKASTRVVLGGVLAMGVTFFLGKIFQIEGL